MTPKGSEKLDFGLVLALRAYEKSPGPGDAAISVNLRFQDDLGPIEALGFEVHSVTDDQALGVLHFRNIGTIAAHPNVLRISAGVEPGLHLDTATLDGRARASSPGTVGPGGGGVWYAAPPPPPRTTAAPTAVPHATGSGGIVAVIHTGIDYTHPSFMSQFAPTKRTRIRRIWDQGLRPASLAQCPDVALLASANTYGVEYKNDAAPNDRIDAALNGGAPLLHKDCIGHGTHVASIAAGGVSFPPGGDARFAGVAPEAGIIAAKLLATPPGIKFRGAAGFGAAVSDAGRV